MKQLGILGMGVISEYYLSAMNAAGASLRGVCDTQPTRLGRFDDDVITTNDVAALLALDDVDSVVVALPNNLHGDVCLAALKKGKHVCCEKPLALHPSVAAELMEYAAARELSLFTAFHRRYNSNVQSAAMRLESRSRRVHRICVRYFERIEDHAGPDAWYLDPTRCGGGCIADNGPNAFDLVRFFAGNATVSQAVIESDPSGIDRRAAITLHTPEADALVLLDWSYAAGEDKRITLFFDDGSTETIDMLAGYPGFKSSLEHEYVGVLREFLLSSSVRCSQPRSANDVDGVAIARLVAEAYAVATPTTHLRLEEFDARFRR